MFQQTPKKRVLFKRTLTRVMIGLFVLATMAYGGFVVRTGKAYAATNSTVNFQARLEGTGGNIAPDGYYNVQFKLYSALSGGSALWTESYYDSNGVTAGNDNRVQVINGYVSVNLGSQTAFPTTINWDQNLYVTMNVGGTAQVASPTYDGEMNPRLQLTGVPYAFTAGGLAQYNSTTGFTSTLNLLQPTGGNQIFQVADQGAAGTYTLLTTAAAGTGYIQNTTSPQTANFNITGTGVAVALQAASLDTASSGTLEIGGTNASTINIANNDVTHTINIAAGATSTSSIQNITIGSTGNNGYTRIKSGGGGIGLYATSGGSISSLIGNVTVQATDNSGRTLFKPLTDATAAFVVQAAGGSAVLNVDTLNGQVQTCALCSLLVGTGGLYLSGGANFTGTSFTTYTTPLGASVNTKINVVNYDPGAYNQIIAFGLPSTANTSSRAITIADARSTAHQPTIAVLSPNENSIGGFSWDGSNTDFSVKSTDKSILLQDSFGVGLKLTGSASTQTTELGKGQSTNGVLQINNATGTASASLQATGVTASYITNLAPAIGVAGQCLSVASVSSSTQSLGYATCGSGTTGVTLQSTTPGTADVGNFNISGVGIAGSFKSSTFDTASAGALSIGATNATAINIGNTASNAVTTVKGTAIFRPVTDSTTAFQVQNTAGASYFTADSANQIITTKQLNVGLASDVSSGKRLFSDGFEDGTTNFWDYGNFTGSSNYSMNTATTHSGKYSIKIISNNGSGFISNHVASSSTVSLRAYIYVTSQTTTADLMGICGDTFSPCISLSRTSAGALTITNSVTGVTSSTTGNLATNGWHKIELTVTNGSSAGITSVYLDNASVLNLTNQNNGTTPFQIVVIGDGGTTDNAVMYFDDVAADTARTGDAAGLSVNDSLHVSGTSTFGDSLSVGGTVNTLSGYAVNSVVGTSTTCTGGTVLQNTVVRGGIVTGGTCASAGSSLQAAYDSSTSPATILLADAKNFVINAAATSTNPNILFNLQCTTSCGSNGRFAVQNAGTDYLVVNPNGTLVIGSASNNITFAANGAYVFNGTSRRTKSITLNAEYVGAVLDAGTGSANSGTMTSGLDLTNRMNYYKWTTTQVTNQSYDVDVQVPIPNDFDSWAANPLAVSSYTTNTTNGTIAIESRDTAGTVGCNFVAVTPVSTSTWSANNTACTLSSGTYTPGGYMTLRIRLQAGTSGDTRVGNIVLSYLSKY